MKKLISLILGCVLFLSCAGFRSAAETKEPVSFTVRVQNVDGLPIPAVFDEDHKSVPFAQIKIGQLLNQCGCDVVCVQEDFQYHSILASQMTNYPYKTLTSGGVPGGDGLNVFSRYPIYNIVRVAWEDSCGVLDNYSDALTPKGFMRVTVDVNGNCVDIYNIHLDAGSSEDDHRAKQNQLNQLYAFIEENSKDRPVAIAGDFNLEIHEDGSEGYVQTFIETGYKDAWAELASLVEGNKYDAAAIKKIYEPSDGSLPYGYYYGKWDSLERVCYNTHLAGSKFQYVLCTDDPDNPESLTNHNGAEATLIFADETAQNEIDLIPPGRFSLLYRLSSFTKGIVKDIFLLTGDVFNKTIKK